MARAWIVNGLVVLGVLLASANVGFTDEVPAPTRPVSIADAGHGAWTTPARPGEDVSTTYRAAPRTQFATSNANTGTDVTLVSETAYYDELVFDAPPMPPPPPPPSSFGMDTIRTAPPTAMAPAPRPVDGTTPYYTNQPYTQPAATSSTGSLPPPGQRCWSGCGLPCEDGISMWRFGAVVGSAFYYGDDPGESCVYWGFDLGRQFCGCWGLDVFYRFHSGTFDRRLADGSTFHDGAEFPDGWHHVGIKFTYGRSIGGSHFYWFVGAGPEYWWTSDYINDDSGFGVYGELGIGYRISQTFSVQLAVMVHGVDTEVTRKSPLDDGDSRWLWIVAPTVGVNVHF